MHPGLTETELKEFLALRGDIESEPRDAIPEHSDHEIKKSGSQSCGQATHFPFSHIFTHM